MTGAGTDKGGHEKDAISYVALHQGQLVAGLLLLVVGVMGFYIYPGGLIYFALPLPTYLWVSLVPLVVAAAFTMRSLVMMERVSMSWQGDLLQVQARRLLSRRVSIARTDMRYVGIRHLESKVLRWAAISALFLTSYEIHFKNGTDLLGHAGIAPFLLFCFAVVCVAVAIYTATPRKFLEIGTDREACFIPLPAIAQGGRTVADIARFLGFHEDTISDSGSVHSALSVIRQNLFSFVSGIVFIAVGVELMSNASWFFGDFAVPAFVLLGVKWIKDSLLGDKKYVKARVAGEFRGCAWGLVAKQIQGKESNVERSIGAVSIHSFEMACYFYLMAQAVKYGFRFAFWPFFIVNPGYLLLGLLVIIVIFLRWFGLADRCTIDFGKFSVSFEVVPAPDPNYFRRGLKGYIMEKVKRFAAAFSLLKGNNRLAWTWILFVLLLLVPILYYGLSYPPYIF
jgi:hypothetical protein